MDCVFSENSGGNGGHGGVSGLGTVGAGGNAGGGAGVFVVGAATATLTNCTIVDNVTGQPGSGEPPGTPAYGGGVRIAGGSGTITNCILWGNQATAGTTEEQQLSGGTITIDYSCVEGWTGGLGGTGNIGSDPGLRDPDNGDYHLTPGSPCVDAGDNTAVPADEVDLDDDGDTTERTPLDLDGLPRFVDDPNTVDTGVADPPDYPQVVDMGAYEFGIPCDLDGDCDVDLGDLAQLLSNYGTTSGASYTDGDVDGDGDVDLSDLAALLAAYNTTCP